MRQGPINGWFGLTYSNYLVIQRSLMSAMPEEWQTKMVELLNEMYDTVDSTGIPMEFRVNAVNEKGRFMKDPFANYKYPPQIPMKEK